MITSNAYAFFSGESPTSKHFIIGVFSNVKALTALETFHMWHIQHVRDPTLVSEANVCLKEKKAWGGW